MKTIIIFSLFISILGCSKKEREKETKAAPVEKNKIEIAPEEKIKVPESEPLEQKIKQDVKTDTVKDKETRDSTDLKKTEEKSVKEQVPDAPSKKPAPKKAEDIKQILKSVMGNNLKSRAFGSKGGLGHSGGGKGGFGIKSGSGGGVGLKHGSGGGVGAMSSSIRKKCSPGDPLCGAGPTTSGHRNDMEGTEDAD